MIKTYFLIFVLFISCYIPANAKWTKQNEAEWKKLKNYVNNASEVERSKPSYKASRERFDSLDDQRYNEIKIRKIDKITENKIAIEKEKKEEKDPKTYWIKARESYKNGDYADAMENIEMVRDLDPTDSSATSFKYKITFMWHWKNNWFFYVGLILLLIFLKIWEMMRAQMRKAPLKLKEKLKEKGRKAALNSNWDIVIKTYNELRHSTYNYDFSLPEQLEISTNMAKAFYNKKSYRSAINEALKVVKFSPHSKSGKELLIECYIATNDRSETAVREYKNYFKLNPNHSEIINILCDEYLKIKSTTEEAMEVYKKKLLKEPENVEINTLLAVKFLRMDERTREAIYSYKIAYAQKPDDENMMLQLTRSYFQNNMWSESLEMLKKVIKIKPNDHEFHKMIEKVYEQLDKKNETVIFYKELKNEFPQSHRINEMIEKLDPNSKPSVSAPIVSNDNSSSNEDSGFKICSACSHLNMGKTNKCENCGAAL